MLRYFTILAVLFTTSLALAVNPSIFLLGNVKGTYTGTAFVLQTSKGIVAITNAHICGKEEVLIAELDKGDRLLVVKQVYTLQDLCVLQAPYGYPTLKLANGYERGDSVSVEGFPGGTRTLTTGRLDKYHLMSKNKQTVMVEYVGSVNFGSSGSPVMNVQGDVVGVISLIYTDTRTGGMIPLEYLKDFIDKLP